MALFLSPSHRYTFKYPNRDPSGTVIGQSSYIVGILYSDNSSQCEERKWKLILFCSRVFFVDVR